MKNESSNIYRDVVEGRKDILSHVLSKKTDKELACICRGLMVSVQST